MIVYLLFILISFLPQLYGKRYNRRQLFRVVAVYMFLLIGCRSLQVGPDSRAYATAYLSYQYKSWNELINFTRGFGNLNILFSILTKACSCVFPNSYTFYFLVISGITTYAVVKFFESFSFEYTLSIIMLMSLTYFLFFMSGIKQTLAMSMIMLSYVAIRRGNTCKFFLLTIAAILFHNSAVVSLIIYPLNKMKFRRWHVAGAFLLILFANMFRNQIVQMFYFLMPEGKYSNYGTSYFSVNNLTGLFIQIVIFGTTVILLMLSNEISEDMKFFLKVYAVGMFFQALTPITAEFFRISMYFSIVGTVMLPEAIAEQKRDNQRLVWLGCIFVFVAYFFVSTFDNAAYIPYRAFWQ